MPSAIKTNRLYLFPVIVFSLAVILRIIYLLVTLYLLNRYPSAIVSVRRIFFNFWTIFWPLIFVAEIIIYSKLKHKLDQRNWVLIHGWSSLIAFLVLPVITTTFVVLFPMFSHDSSMQISFYYFSIVRRISFWTLVAVGHLFFILTIVKSFNKQEPVHESPGLLDEFLS